MANHISNGQGLFQNFYKRDYGHKSPRRIYSTEKPLRGGFEVKPLSKMVTR